MRADVVARFNANYEDSFQYAAGFSFCPPTSIQMIRNDKLHLITYSDAAHNFISGIQLQTNLSGSNSDTVSGMSTVCSFNEGGLAWKMHYEALKKTHPTVTMQEWSSLEVNDKEHPFDDYKHTGVMDGNKGSQRMFHETFSEVSLPQTCLHCMSLHCSACMYCAMQSVSLHAACMQSSLVVNS